VALAIAAFGLLHWTSGPSNAQGNFGNPGIIPPDARFRGRSYSEWQADWWKWVFSVPVSAPHPFIPGGHTLAGQSGNVVFLVGPGAFEVRQVTIRAGTALFFPVVNAECSVLEPPPFHGDNEQALRACAKLWMDGTVDLACHIDGRAVNNLAAYRRASTLFEFGPLPAENILGAPEGATSPPVDDGVYLMVAPLPVGAHEIDFTGTFMQFGGFTIDITHILTVVPGP
jgi:hypothetical protein